MCQLILPLGARACYLATGNLGLMTELFKQIVEGDGIRPTINNVALWELRDQGKGNR